MFVPIKLVRDDIPADGRIVMRKPETPEEERYAIASLRRKLVEEALEYMQEPSLSELADVFEVLTALLSEDLGLDSFGYVLVEAQIKRERRGGFMGLTIMGVEIDDGSRPD